MDGQQLIATVADALHSLAQELTSARLLIQFGLILLAAVIGTIAASLIRRRIDITVPGARWPQIVRKLARLLIANLATIIFVLVLDVMRAVMMAITWPSASYLLGVAASLATAWVLIALITGLIRNQFVYRVVAISAWTIAALSILGYLDPTVAALNSVGIMFGNLRVTPLLVIKTSVLLMLALW